MPDFSVITCVSNPEVYESCLLASVRAQRQHYDVELIPIINNDNRYSASNALNIGIEVARSNYLVLCHQDVRLLDDWFDRALATIANLSPNWGIMGAAGISLTCSRKDVGDWGGALAADTVAVGSVWDSDQALNFPPYWDGLKDPLPVHAADECLLVLNKRTGLRFDTLFTGFHFYGADLCLQARAAGYLVYGAELPIVHYGKYSGSYMADQRYWYYLRLLYYKWRERFPELLGTHMHWTATELTSYIPFELRAADGLTVRLKAAGLQRLVTTGDGFNA